MKLFKLTFALIFLATTAFAQQVDTLKTKESKMDTSYLQVGGKKIIVIEDHSDFDERFDNWGEKDDTCNKGWDVDIKINRKFNGHFAGFELGLNNYLNPDYQLDVPEGKEFLELDDSRSIQFNWNIGDVSIPIVKNRFGIVTGLGISWSNYKFDNKQLVLQNDRDSIYVDTVAQGTMSYSKNKLTTVYLNVPLMLEVQAPLGDKEFWFAVGGYGGLKIGSHTKLETNTGDKSKSKKDFHVNTLTYGLRAQVGFDHFGFYCNYNLQSLFKKDEGPELYPISLGVSLAF